MPRKRQLARSGRGHEIGSHCNWRVRNAAVCRRFICPWRGWSFEWPFLRFAFIVVLSLFSIEGARAWHWAQAAICSGSWVYEEGWEVCGTRQTLCARQVIHEQLVYQGQYQSGYWQEGQSSRAPKETLAPTFHLSYTPSMVSSRQIARSASTA